MAKFAYVVCKCDKSKNELIDLNSLKIIFNCDNIINITKNAPSKLINFSEMKIKNLKRLRKEFNPFMLGMYDISGFGSHAINLYMFGDEAKEDDKNKLQSSLNLIKYEKNKFINFSATNKELEFIFGIKDLIMWLIYAEADIELSKKQWISKSVQYMHILTVDEINYVMRKFHLNDDESNKIYNKILADLRERMIISLMNGWNE